MVLLVAIAAGQKEGFLIENVAQREENGKPFATTRLLVFHGVLSLEVREN